MSDGDYLGYVILQSLADKTWLDRVRIQARRQVGSWTFLLVPVHPQDLDTHLADLQHALLAGEPWYADYARDQELLVVFKDAVYNVGGDPLQWKLAVEHGQTLGIPIEQLDFKLRSEQESLKFFSLTVAH